MCIPDLCIQTPRQNTTTQFTDFEVAKFVAETFDDARYNAYDALLNGEFNNDTQAEEYFVNNLRERIIFHMNIFDDANITVNKEICTNVPVFPREIYYTICEVITVELIIPCFDTTF